MYGKIDAALPIVLLVIVGAFLVMPDITPAQKNSVPNWQEKLAMGEGHAKQLLLLIGTDINGKIMNHKITKQEWLTFMGAEFDRLDLNKNGEIDLAELEQAMRGKHTASK
jgi:hypothetical protein